MTTTSGGRVTEGDVVLVSGAAGGVGSLAGQIAKRLGTSSAGRSSRRPSRSRRRTPGSPSSVP